MLTKHGAKLANKVYDNKVVYPPFLLINLKDYHNGLIWFGMLCGNCCFYKNDFKEDAFNLFKVMAKKITRDNTMYEVYEPKKGKAVKRLFYKSEQGFAWLDYLYGRIKNCLINLNRYLSVVSYKLLSYIYPTL